MVVWTASPAGGAKKDGGMSDLTLKPTWDAIAALRQQRDALAECSAEQLDREAHLRASLARVAGERDEAWEAARHCWWQWVLAAQNGHPPGVGTEQPEAFLAKTLWLALLIEADRERGRER
jgi:hypothetical protein